MLTLKILGLLLDYPGEELNAVLPEMEAVLVAENRLPPAQTEAVRAVIRRFRATDLLDLQEDYVGLFDRSRALSLHLFEHVHGESRDRGQAMVDLLAMYQARGLSLDRPELPDYLPLFLEFLSLLPADEAGALLGEVAHILAALAGRLERRHPGYHAVLAALRHLAGDPAGTVAVVTADQDQPIDDAWAEAEVTFGAGAALQGCPAARDTLARM